MSSTPALVAEPTRSDLPALEEGEIVEETGSKSTLRQEMDTMREENEYLEKALQASHDAARKGRDYLKENIRLLSEAAELHDQLASYADEMKNLDAIKKENLLLRTELKSARQDLKTVQSSYNRLKGVRTAALHSFKTGLGSLHSAFNALQAEETKVPTPWLSSHQREHAGDGTMLHLGPAAEKRRSSPPSSGYGASHYSPSKRQRTDNTVLQQQPAPPLVTNPKIVPLGPRSTNPPLSQPRPQQQPPLIDHGYISRVLTQAGIMPIKEEQRRP